MRRRLVFIAPLAIIGLLLFIALGGMVVQLLWNWLMPSIFDVRQITWWQAVGLLALTRMLFGGFGRHGCGRSGMRRRIETGFRGANRATCDSFVLAMPGSSTYITRHEQQDPHPDRRARRHAGGGRGVLVACLDQRRRGCERRR